VPPPSNIISQPAEVAGISRLASSSTGGAGAGAGAASGAGPARAGAGGGLPQDAPAGA
jgi:hypothetical protein